MTSRRGPAELSVNMLQELIQAVLEMNEFLISCFAQPLSQGSRREDNYLLPFLKLNRTLVLPLEHSSASRRPPTTIKADIK